MKSKYTPQALKPLLSGVVNMQFTPWTDMKMDEAALRDNTRFMIENGIVAGSGVQMIGGQVGEGGQLSDQEYRQLVDVIVSEAAGRVPIGVACLRQSSHAVVELAHYAEEAGADFILVMPPYYWPHLPVAPATVIEHYQALARTIKIAIMIHNDPRTTGQNLSPEVLEELAKIPQIVAYKEDNADFGGLRDLCYRFKNRFMINANSYKSMIPLDYQSGLVGHNSFLANVDPAFALRQHEIALSGDFDRAQELWIKTKGLYRYLAAQPGASIIQSGKEMARLAGRPMGNCERLPHRRPGEVERAKLREYMLTAGMTVK